jgi:hypothetical protein
VLCRRVRLPRGPADHATPCARAHVSQRPGTGLPCRGRTRGRCRARAWPDPPTCAHSRKTWWQTWMTPTPAPSRACAACPGSSKRPVSTTRPPPIGPQRGWVSRDASSGSAVRSLTLRRTEDRPGLGEAPPVPASIGTLTAPGPFADRRSICDDSECEGRARLFGRGPAAASGASAVLAAPASASTGVGPGPADTVRRSAAWSVLEAASVDMDDGTNTTEADPARKLEALASDSSSSLSSLTASGSGACDDDKEGRLASDASSAVYPSPKSCQTGRAAGPHLFPFPCTGCAPHRQESGRPSWP